MPPTYLGFSPQPAAGNNYLANGDLQARLYPASGGITLLRIPATTADVTMTGMSITTAAGGNFPTFRVFADTTWLEGILSPKGNIQPVTDNAISAGTAGRRFTTVYAANATINTSDEREKHEIEAIPDAVLDAWGEVDWVQFRRIDGDRIHTGLVAQRVIAAFAAQGLDAMEWGVLCYDEWEDDFEDALGPVTEEDGTVNMVPTGERRLALAAGNRYGIRYEEAALRRRSERQLLARLDAIEARGVLVKRTAAE